MDIKKIISNKWTKRGLLVAALVGLGFGVKAAVNKNRNKNEFMLEPDFDNSSVTDPTVSTIVNTAANPTAPNIPGMTKYGKLSYNRTAVAVGNKRYEFTKSGVVKLQKYFAKNGAAKAEIEKSGGYDGVIGATFAKILNWFLNSIKDVSIVSFAAKIDKTMPGIIKNAGLTSSEYSISSL